MSTAALLGARSGLAADDAPRFSTRGVVLYPWDLSLADWPERAARAGLTTIALHAAQRLDVLTAYVRSDAGAAFLSGCRKLGIQVEYELHALGQLLSRELFYQDDSLFRLDENGRRNPDSNCCPSSEPALAIAAEKAVDTVRALRPTTHRFFFWPDDGGQWCRCSRCKDLGPSDQAVLVENAIASALRKHIDTKAQVCHIAYHHTLEPPRKVKPHPGLFLEFAPINRSYQCSIGDRGALLAGTSPVAAIRTHGDLLDLLDANLEVFGRETAQVLEYWLDASMASGWQRPSKKLSWNGEIVKQDVQTYAEHGIRHIASFATWLDADYVMRFSEPPVQEYGSELNNT